MKRTSSGKASALRRDLRACIEEYFAAARTLPGATQMVRGTIYWSRRASGKRYPNISVTMGGAPVKRRVRVEDTEWLEGKLAKHRAYRATQTRLRALHQRVMELSDRLCEEMTGDYVPGEKEEGHGA
jgi:hypothetical protein